MEIMLEAAQTTLLAILVWYVIGSNDDDYRSH